jgi:hypothetical protein
VASRAMPREPLCVAGRGTPKSPTSFMRVSSSRAHVTCAHHSASRRSCLIWTRAFASGWSGTSRW